MIAQIGCALPPVLAVGVIVWRRHPTLQRRRLVREARRLVAWCRLAGTVALHPEDDPRIYRVEHGQDRMPCPECLAEWKGRPCPLCGGAGFLEVREPVDRRA